MIPPSLEGHPGTTESLARFLTVDAWTDAVRWCESNLDLSEEDRDRLADQLAVVEEHGR